MGHGTRIGQLERLDQLLAKLKTGDTHTATGLAQELGVSLRTLMRDLNSLRDKGYPIDANKGRGGGIRLQPGWGVGRLSLNFREVLDLLLALAVMERLDNPLFMQQLSSVRDKLIASIPDSRRSDVAKFRSRILIGDIASMNVLHSYEPVPKNPVTDRVLDAFIAQRQLRIRYKREDGKSSTRCIELHYLHLNWPVWHLLTWDHPRVAPRIFRLDRITSSVVLDDRFQTRPLYELFPEMPEFSERI